MIDTVDSLDLEALPVGEVTRVWVELTRDGLGQPEAVPVLIARGRRPGPVVGLTAAIHGNELNGIPVIHRLFDRIDAKALRGTVVGVPVVNLWGYHRMVRRFQEQLDLNHLFPGRPDGDVGDVYIHRFFNRIVRQFDVLLDMHTASFGRVNCLYVRADMREPRSARMAFLQRPEIIVHKPSGDGSLRGMAEKLGIPSITIEIGDPHRFQKRYIKRTLTGIRAVLMDLEVIPQRPLVERPAPVICSSSVWTYTDEGGLLTVHTPVTEHVVKGQEVAELVDVFGMRRAVYHAPQDGVVIGHSVQPVSRTGARIVHLGSIATPDDDHLILEGQF